MLGLVGATFQKRVGTGGTVQKEAGVEKEADDEMI